jgi:hypothetical protein
MMYITLVSLLLFVEGVASFQSSSCSGRLALSRRGTRITRCPIFLLSAPSDEEEAGAPAREGGLKEEPVFASEEEKKEAVGNLVADDEWAGVTMELSELVRKAVVEDIKTKAREFLGKEDYNVGDISKEIDKRVKDGVAQLRGKDDYELFDFVMAMDEMSKNMTEEITGKPYEAGKSGEPCCNQQG